MALPPENLGGRLLRMRSLPCAVRYSPHWPTE